MAALQIKNIPTGAGDDINGCVLRQRRHKDVISAAAAGVFIRTSVKNRPQL
jgi:hypothetical protein